MIKKLKSKGLSIEITVGELKVFDITEDKIILIVDLIGNKMKLFECEIDIHTLDLINRLITQLKELE